MSVEENKRILFELFYDRVYKIAYFIVKDPHVAQDIVQETFIKAFRNIEDCPNGEKAGAWLSTIATRTAIDHIRSQKRRNTLPADHVIIDEAVLYKEDTPVETEVEKELMVEHILDQLETMDPEQREIIMLKYLYELKDRGIAELLKSGLWIGV